MTIKFLGIDLAKNVFQLHGTDADGMPMLNKRLRRDQMLPELARSSGMADTLQPGWGWSSASIQAAVAKSSWA